MQRAERWMAPAGIALFGVLGWLMAAGPGSYGSAAAGAVVVAAAGLLVRWPKGRPMRLGLAASAGAFVYLGHQQSSSLAWMGLCVVAGWVALDSAVAVASAVGGALCAIVVAEWLLDRSEAGWGAWFVGVAFSTVSCIFARRLRLTVAQLKEAQAQLAERTRAEERNRIAAEVHDVIGHALTVSLLHVGSARLALNDDPEQARRSLEEAERLARASLDEVRTTVGMLRSDSVNRRAPLPGAADIPALIESFRRAEADVRLEVVGRLERLSAGRGLAVYRIVQEALTNSTKHATGLPVTVWIKVGDRDATVRVRNDLRVHGTDVPHPAAGAGLLGMQERAQGVGGRVAAGPDRAGWLVEAVLPR